MDLTTQINLYEIFSELCCVLHSISIHRSNVKDVKLILQEGAVSRDEDTERQRNKDKTHTFFHFSVR